MCPSPELLRGLLIGEVSEEASVVISEHLMRCLTCQAATQTLSTNDTLLSLVRQAGRQPLAKISADVQRVIATIRVQCKVAALLLAHQDTQLSFVDDSVLGSKPRSRSIDDELTDLLSSIRPAESPEELGRVGDFRLLKLLGYGGMGAVFLAEDIRLQRPVALKLVRADAVRSRFGRERFLREARSAAKIKHENVVTIYQVGEENGVPFLAQEYLEGETLQQRLARDGRLSVASALSIGQQIAMGLVAAHGRGLVHRDIKPANVFLATNSHTPGGTEIAKLLDFGLARAMSDSTLLTQSGLIIGTPAFMSPEQANGDAVDHRTDLFSLGCVLYVMVTGQRPFHGENMMRILSSLAFETPTSVNVLRPEVPADFSRLIDQLLAKSVDDRTENANDVVARMVAIRLASDASQRLLPMAQPAAPAVTPPKRTVKTFLALFGGISTFALLSVIIITVTNQDGTKSRYQFPDTSTIKIVNESAKTPADTIKTPQEVTTPNTTASESVIKIAADETKGIDASNSLRTKSMGPTPTDHLLPYVILHDGQAVGEFADLPVQRLEYRVGDVIEVRGNGPFHLPRIATDRGLILRAAEGFQPVFVPDDTVLANEHWIMIAKGPLRLEGCEFRRMRLDDLDIFAVFGDSFEIVNCTLARGAANNPSLTEFRCPTVRIADSLLISGAGHVGFSLHPEVREFSIENSIYLCNAYCAISIDQSELPRTFRLEHNTFSGPYFLFSGGLFQESKDHPAREPLRIIARHNLFTSEITLVAQISNGQLTMDDFRSRITWQGEGNVAPKFIDQIALEELAGSEKAGLISLPQLRVPANRAWAANATVADRVAAIRQAVTADQPESAAEVEINWDQIGPGLGYLNTLDPQERDREQPEALLDGGPFTLVHAEEQARGFATLADAVRASLDGDTIELRTNESLTASLDLSIPGRRLTIRAARGYQPKFLDTSMLRLGSGHDWEFVNLNLYGSLGTYCHGQIRRVQNCAFEVGELRDSRPYGLYLSGHESSGPEVEVVNCVLPGLTVIGVAPGRKVVFRNSVLQSCELGTPSCAEGDQFLSLEACVILNAAQPFPLMSIDHPQGRGFISASHCLFDGCFLFDVQPDRLTWTGDRNQFRLWNHAWYREGSLGQDILDLMSWQQRWGSDANSTSGSSIYFDPQQWRSRSSGGADLPDAGVDFTRFHRPPALR